MVRPTRTSAPWLGDFALVYVPSEIRSIQSYLGHSTAITGSLAINALLSLAVLCIRT